MNIILIGFKASGKTTVGKALAQQSERTFIDTDRLLEHRHQQKTGERLSFRKIFSLLSDEGFRRLETEVLADLPEQKNAVIATGGGMAARIENIPLLKQSGYIVFMNTPFSTIKARLNGTDSPLFTTSSVQELYQARYAVYHQAANLVFTPAEHVLPKDLAISLKTLIDQQNIMESEVCHVA